MDNILAYLVWRGDLNFMQSEFNDIDALILSGLAYVPFEGIVSSTSKGISLRDAAARFFSRKQEKQPHFIHREDRTLFIAAAKSDRFGGMLVSRYVNDIDPEEEKQFAAVTFTLDDGTDFIAYRGTDDTLVGWKEDFNLSFLKTLPSQHDAAAYLEQTTARRKLRVGGHSKGGNLAIYAAVYCKTKVKNRIIAVYNHDGPGFSAEMLESREYMEIADRIETFIPQSSVIGMLFEHEDNYHVVKSSQSGLLQHDMLSWNVEGSHFVILDDVTEESRLVDQTVKGWIAEMSEHERKLFVDALYDIISSSDAHTLGQLNEGWFKNAVLHLQALKHIDEQTRKIVSETLRLLWRTARKNIALKSKAKKQEAKKEEQWWLMSRM